MNMDDEVTSLKPSKSDSWEAFLNMDQASSKVASGMSVRSSFLGAVHCPGACPG